MGFNGIVISKTGLTGCAGDVWIWEQIFLVQCEVDRKAAECMCVVSSGRGVVHGGDSCLK